MITVTESAVRELTALLFENATQPEDVLRLLGGSGGFALGIDCEREGDEKVKGESGTILVIDTELSSLYDGATIDCIDTPEGVRLTVIGGERFSL